MVTRTFSLTNFVIASSALCFQVFVLYPWHKELDEGFAEMRREHAQILREGRKEMERELSGIRRELQLLREGKEKVGGTSRGFIWSSKGPRSED
jgi:hypothetical protein